jgi:hypothetical protein
MKTGNADRQQPARHCPSGHGGLLRGEAKDFGEGISIIDREVGKDLPVDGDVLLIETVDQLGVGHAVRAGGSVDTRYPQLAETALLGTTITVRVPETLVDLVFGNGIDLASRRDESFRTLQQFLATTMGSDFIL